MTIKDKMCGFVEAMKNQIKGFFLIDIEEDEDLEIDSIFQSIIENKENSVVVARPTKYEDVIKISEPISDGSIVLLDVDALSQETTRRIIDFCCGSAVVSHAIVEHIAPNFFIFGNIDLKQLEFGQESELESSACGIDTTETNENDGEASSREQNADEE